MKKHTPNKHERLGFALVVTLSLMVLLTIVAVGLLSLSAISLRATSQDSAQAEARANARLALMLAIGDLQKQMGPDQRVSASGAITEVSTVKHPHWAGVWNSWKAGAEKDSDSEHSTIAGAQKSSMAPTYEARRKDQFRAWLVSLNDMETTDVASPTSVLVTGTTMPAAKADAVQLVGTGSLGTNSKVEDQVHARLLNVKSNSSGRYGWWVGDESQKARVMSDEYPKSSSLTLAQRIFRQQAPGSTGTSAIKGLENIKNDSQIEASPTWKSLDLVQGAVKPSENFHSVSAYSAGVLSDVREGGLKRDLSTLLERPIDVNETQDPFILYRFDTAGQERVPIQDLAAYYQMYDSSRDPDKGKGIRYTSSPQNTFLTNGIQVAMPDYGESVSTQRYLREYTSFYRAPIPIKVQFLVGMKAEPLANVPAGGNTHRLVLGYLPAVTLWNPNNVPITMNMGDPNYFSQVMRFMNLSFAIEWRLSSGYVSKPVTLAYASSGVFGNTKTGQAGVSNKNEIIFDMYFSATNPVVFKPGEVKLFSYDFSKFTGNVNNFSMDGSGAQKFVAAQEGQPGWNPYTGFLKAPRSAWTPDPQSADKNYSGGFLTFKASDTISMVIKTEKECGLPYAFQNGSRGSAFFFNMSQKSNAVQSGRAKWGYNNYNVTTRTGATATDTRDFNDSLVRKGYPGSPVTTSISGSTLIGMANSSKPLDQWKAFLQFALMAGSETSEASNGTPFAGRKFASRPYLHSSPLAPPFIDGDDGNSLYNYGWNWWVEGIGSVLEAYIENDPNDIGRGFYGGGYSAANGTGTVVQQEIPVTPPISIAALSHARLGGYSVSNEDPTAPPSGSVAYQRVAAVGFGGLFPQTMQAIGNSYAHPLLPADKAFRNDWTRTFLSGSPRQVTLADHSYLANKALWDEYFFSSITPQPSAVRVFDGSTSPDAKTTASDFALNDKPLPNRRFTPYKLDQGKLDQLYTSNERISFTGGLADKIAAHLMLTGSFNVNSTSVEAWKVLLSSLKGKPVAYLDKDKSVSGVVELDEITPNGTPVGPGSLPNGKPYSSSSKAPSDAAQWSNWRELSDSEIAELANAIVKQVKIRGPFLSMSEFVNRRLDSSNEELSVKGALQAALDDPSVSINSGFRSGSRVFSDAEVLSMNPAFKKALEGPVAYGSAAYVDQADVLRNFAEQLTPRGDTFVIRTYGDSLDPNGKVLARAWCEAVVQRLPEYLDAADAPYVKQADLSSAANKSFGRKFEIVTFRWLVSMEV